MADNYEYILSLKDQMSGTMGKIMGTSGQLVTRMQSMAKSQRELAGVSKDLGGSIFALKGRIDLLQAEKELINPSNMTAIRQYNREIQQLEGQIRRLDNTGKSWLTDLKGQLSTFINPATMAAAAVGFSAKSAMGFDEGMAKINITAQLDDAGLRDLQDRIKQIAKNNEQEIAVSPAGFESIISQVGNVEQSLDILDASMRGARAGFTDQKTVADALAQSLSVIGDQSVGAGEVLDTFLAAKRVGAGEFADFSNYLPGMIAGASTLGIKWREVAGAFAYMTGKGQSAERAQVLMSNAFSVLSKGDIVANLKKTGVAVYDQEGNMRSLMDVMTDMQRVMGGMTDQQKSSYLEGIGIVDKEAKGAFAILTSDINKLNEAMTATANASGETDTALSLAGNSVQSATDLWTQFKNIGFELGTAVLPIVNMGMDILGGVLSIIEPVLTTVFSIFSEWLTDLSEGNIAVWGITGAIAGLTIALNLTTIATKAKLFWDGIVTGATWLWTAAQWALNIALNANPIGLIITAVGALIGIIIAVVSKTQGWGKQWSVIVKFCGNLWDLFVETVKFRWSVLSNGIMLGLDMIKLGWYKFKEAVGMGDSSENKRMINQINTDVNDRKKAIVDGAKKVGDLAKKTADSLTWELSWKDENKPPKTPETPETPDGSANSLAQIEEILNGLNNGKKGSKKSSTEKIDLGDASINRMGSSAYSTIASRLNPIQFASLASKAAASVALPIAMAMGSPVSTNANPFDVAKSDYMSEQVVPVKVVEMSPSVLSMLPKSTTPEIIPNESVVTEYATGPKIRVDRFCDQVVINIASADSKGYDQIRSEVESVIMDILDDYDA